MKHGHLQRLLSLDGAAFAAHMRRLGFESAALYRIEGGRMTQLVASSTDEQPHPDIWPVVVTLDHNYTPVGSRTPALPWGWVKPDKAPFPRDPWRKGTSFYFPEQELFEIRMVFAVKPAAGKRCRTGDLDPILEATAARIRFIQSRADRRAEISEFGFKEHVRSLGVDLKMLINHELRTPLSSVAGYSTLLQDAGSDQSDQGDTQEFSRVILAQANYALEALEKLSLALDSDDEDQQVEVATFDAAKSVMEFCWEIKQRAVDIVSEEAAGRTNIRFRKSTDRECMVDADPRLFRWAIWEVLKNAVIHSKAGKVEVQVYTSEEMLVIDILDDGRGVSEGAEELIFLRFYQDPSTHASRKGKRGLGLGLFLARHLAERHFGQLRYIRNRTKGGTFRFLWPLAAEGVRNLSKGA